MLNKILAIRVIKEKNKLIIVVLKNLLRFY